MEDKVRKYIVSNISPSEIEGYDPSQSDTTASDYILITSDNDDWGEYYPLIWVGETDGPTVPNGGESNINSLQGDGSGNNQFSVYNVTISVQAVEGGPYLNGVDYDDLVFTIWQEIQSLFDGTTDLSETTFVGKLTPATQSRDANQADAGSTDTWDQRQGTLPVGVLYEP